MVRYLVKNGAFYCGLLSALDPEIRTAGQNRWHDCVLLVDKRVDPSPTDLYEIHIEHHDPIPFRVARCRVAADGWEVAGKILL